MTVRVNIYFPPIRMTYPIQPKPFFRAAPNILSSSELFKIDRRLTVLSSIAAASPPWRKPSNSVWPRVPSWIGIRWIQYATHRNNFKLPPVLAMSTARQNTAPTSSQFIPGQHFLETFTLLSPNNQDYTFMDDYIIPVLNQQTWPLLHLWRPYVTHTFNNALTWPIHFLLRHLAAKIPSQLHNYFLPSFLRDSQHKHKPFIPCCY